MVHLEFGVGVQASILKEGQASLLKTILQSRSFALLKTLVIGQGESLGDIAADLLLLLEKQCPSLKLVIVHCSSLSASLKVANAPFLICCSNENIGR